MYGIFFEDINFAADGGLYAELIKTAVLNLTNHLQDGNSPTQKHFLLIWIPDF